MGGVDPSTTELARDPIGNGLHHTVRLLASRSGPDRALNNLSRQVEEHDFYLLGIKVDSDGVHPRRIHRQQSPRLSTRTRTPHLEHEALPHQLANDVANALRAETCRFRDLSTAHPHLTPADFGSYNALVVALQGKQILPSRGVSRNGRRHEVIVGVAIEGRAPRAVPGNARTEPLPQPDASLPGHSPAHTQGMVGSPKRRAGRLLRCPHRRRSKTPVAPRRSGCIVTW